ncbi:glycogen-binding subunit 76A [Drosophila elegans]|uniref:glycogen-binding subunit 76A n=1 Tax=Drosophila elegans TaxID=30023 RepID=UPI0007E5E251|nr:glycogen-binding subunit 76A [Drosophila elegans]XP_017127554.1 glycogen-binding subunit 76A [Drosophila elegans]
MNDPGDIPLTHTSTPDSRPPCSIISIIPTIGMSSCRGRAEAFARSLSSKLRTLGSQTTEEGEGNAEDEPIINGTSTNTWVNSHDSEQTVTDLQPLRHESDSFFDFDCELESPGSPVDECEYLRLIETASNTPHNSTAESGYACASMASSHSSSTDGPYFDATASGSASASAIAIATTSASTSTAAAAQDQKLPASELKDYVNTLQLNGRHGLVNGVNEEEEAAGQDAIQPEDEAFLQAQILSELQQHSISLRVEEEKFTNGHLEDVKTLEVAGPTNKAPEELHKDVFTEKVEELTLTEGETPYDRVQKESSQEGVTKESHQEVVPKESFQERVHEDIHNERVEERKGEEETPNDRVQEETPSDRVQEKTPNERVQEETSNDKSPTDTSPERTPTEESSSPDRTTQEARDVELSPDSGMDETDKSASNLTVNVDLAQIEQAKQDATDAVEKSGATHSHGIDTTDDEDDCRPQRIRRCSSLKTGKTPPGTPGRKKIVRFADVLGLDLADVKTFLDEIPTIPKSAFEDLEILESEPPLQLGPKSDKLLMPLFQQPGGLPKFLDAVREKQVSLENAAVSDNINQTISGSVRVRNLDFHKSVHIRYSLDGWRSYADLQANYVENSCDGFSDIFTFVLFGNSLHVGQRLEFAVRFQCKGQQFWDNNYGANYCFQCLPSSTHATGTCSSTASPPSVVTGAVTTGSHPGASLVGLLSPTAGDAWCSSFY